MRPILKNILAVLSLSGSLTSVAAQSDAAPNYPNYTQIWTDSFTGTQGNLPSTTDWNIVTGSLGVNNELEEYSNSNENIRLSGGSTLQIIPRRNASVTTGWTSGRIESTASWAPQGGVVTRVEALVSFGTNAISTKQGMWPAFWMLGQSLREGQDWPGCGELDIFEGVNGILTGHGTVHCGAECNDSGGGGLGESVDFPDQLWHTWRLEWDRTSGNWATETIKWSMDDQVYHTITGGEFTEDTWGKLAHEPYYIILNLAVGGSWVSLRTSLTRIAVASLLSLMLTLSISTSLVTQMMRQRTERVLCSRLTMWRSTRHERGGFHQAVDNIGADCGVVKSSPFLFWLYTYSSTRLPLRS